MATDAQLTSPDEPVCIGEQVVFVCQRTSTTSLWAVHLPLVTLQNSAAVSQAGTVTFQNDPGFGFEIRVFNFSQSSAFVSELHVTAVSQLNGVTLECDGSSGSFMSTIQISSSPGKYCVAEFKVMKVIIVFNM